MATSTTDQQRRFAVFGAQGYLWRHLAAHLRAQGHRVDAYDLQPAAGPAFDVANPAHWDRADTDVDAVFFFAGMTGRTRASSSTSAIWPPTSSACCTCSTASASAATGRAACFLPRG